MASDAEPWTGEDHRPPRPLEPQQADKPFVAGVQWVWERQTVRQHAMMGATYIIGLMSRSFFQRPTVALAVFVAAGLVWWFVENERDWVAVVRAALAAFGFYLVQDVVLGPLFSLTAFEVVLLLLGGVSLMFAAVHLKLKC